VQLVAHKVVIREHILRRETPTEEQPVARTCFARLASLAEGGQSLDSPVRDDVTSNIVRPTLGQL